MPARKPKLKRDDAPKPKPNSKGMALPTRAQCEAVIAEVANGQSLRSVCLKMGLHPSQTHRLIDDDPDLHANYARAREERADYYQEVAIGLGMQASKGERDPNGVRVALDAIKWATARMAPKTAPATKHEHSFTQMSSEQRRAEIARLQAEIAELDDDD